MGTSILIEQPLVREPFTKKKSNKSPLAQGRDHANLCENPDG